MIPCPNCKRKGIRRNDWVCKYCDYNLVFKKNILEELKSELELEEEKEK